MVRHLARVAVAALALAGGCDLGSVTVPGNPPVIVVHGILSPQVRVQQIRVSFSLTGANNTGQGADVPIPDPVNNASVSITGPDGQVLSAQSHDGLGTYYIDLDQYTDASGGRVSIQGGRRYDLQVVVLNDTIRGHTTVPVTSRTLGGTTTFNRDTDSLRYDFSGVAMARGFWIRVESRGQAFQLLTADPQVAIPGMVRNIAADNLSHTFFPGFLQTITAVAADTNVYEYTRTGSDPFSGVGLINSVTGGFGLFGSINEINRRAVRVTASPTGDAIEGRFTLRSGGIGPTDITLYVESPGVHDVPAQITGNYFQPGFGTDGVLGTRESDGHIELKFLTNYQGSDGKIFAAVQRGDSLIATNSAAVFVRFGK